MSHDPTSPQPPHEDSGYEHSDLSIPAIVKFGVAFAIFIGVAHVIMVVMFFVLRHEQGAPVTPVAPRAVHVTPPLVGPQLEVNPTANWEAMREAQNKMLHGYGWVTPQTGTVRIPIEQAMELALERGFPVRAAATQQADAK